MINDKLFRPEGLDGSYVGGFACWDESGYGAGYDHHKSGFDADVESYGGVDEHGSFEESAVHFCLSDGSVHILVGCDAEQHADVSEEGGDDDALNDDESQDAGRLCSDGLADSEFASALFHGDKHDVGYADNATEEGEDTDDPQGCAYDAHSGVHLQVLCEAVPYPDGLFIVGSRPVVGVDVGAVSVFEFIVVFLAVESVEREEYVVGLVASIVHGSDSREGGVGVGVHTAGIVLEYSDDPKGETSHFDMFSHEGRDPPAPPV